MKVDKSKWEKVKLGSICMPKQMIQWQGNTTLYHYVDLSSVPTGTNLIESTQEINAETAPSRAKQIINEGDILFGTTRPMLKRCCIVPSNLDGQICSTGFCVVKPTPNKLYSQWAYMNLISRSFYDYISPLQKGVAYPAVSDKDIKNFSIPLPSLPEQRAIAEELDGIQSMIGKCREQLEDYDRLARSIFHEMFGDPVKNDKGWEVSDFCELFNLKSGDALSAKNQVPGSFPVYGGNGISGFHNQGNRNGEYVIIGRVGANCGNVRLVKGSFWLTDNAFQMVQHKNNFNLTFAVFLLKQHKLGQYAHKAAQPVISNTVLAEISIIIPPLPLQQQFATRIEAIEAMKEATKAQLADLQQLFDSRMQYYFS